MKAMGEVLKLATQYLKEKQDVRARRHAEELMSSVLKLPRLDLYLQFDRPLHEEELTTYRALLKRKAQGEPLDYILGEVLFYHCPLYVSSAVLIPRPETEILLDKVCDRLRGLSLQGKQAWDICCGSGCLGIGLKKTFPELKISLSDLSQEALQVAERNCQRNQVEVEVLHGDLFAPFQGRRGDFVVCNPPYVSQKEFSMLDAAVSRWEPKMALLGGESGLLFYERLSRELPAYLHPGAEVFLEIGAEQGAVVAALFSASHWKTKRLEKDWAGHDRFFFLEFD